MIVKSEAWEGMGAKDFLANILAACETVIVKSEASTSCVPMALVPLPILKMIVKSEASKARALE